MPSADLHAHIEVRNSHRVVSCIHVCLFFITLITGAFKEAE